MDLAFSAIQPPMQTSPPVRMRRNGGKSGRRLAVSNSAPQSTSATSNTKLVVLIVADVVAPYAHGAYTRAAKKIHRDALRKMIEITKAKISSRDHCPITSRALLSVPCQKASCITFLTRSWHPALASNAGYSKDRISAFLRHPRRSRRTDN